MTRRIGVLLTHPVQYYAPLFRELASRGDVDLEVLFAHHPTAEQQGEDFGVPFTWDVDLTSGYAHAYLANVSDTPGVGFGGYDTPEVGERIAGGGYDAFIVCGWHARSYWQATRACHRAGIPVLVRGDSQLGAADRGARGLAKSAVYPFFVRRYASCLAAGVRSTEYFRHYGARRIETVPHFVDNEFFAAAAAMTTRADARRSLGLPTDGTVILFAGKLVERKNPVDVIRAAGQAGVPLSVLMVGDGALRAECERAAAEVGVPVVFAGFMNQSQLPRAYRAADVLALPSNDRETWGLVVNEAMACGLTAVVSDAVGCVPDLIEPGVTGYSHPEGDIAAMASAFATLATESTRLSAMQRAARRRVAAFTPGRAAESLVRAVEAVAGA